MEETKIDDLSQFEDLKPSKNVVEQIEAHHVIPISLGGLNIETNLKDLFTSPHRLIHETLHVSSNALRGIRKKINSQVDESDLIKILQIQQEYQSLYFRNMHLLPAELIQIHYESFVSQINEILDQIEMIEKIVRNLGIDEQDIPEVKISKLDSQDTSHILGYHTLLGDLKMKKGLLLEEKKFLERYKEKKLNIGL